MTRPTAAPAYFPYSHRTMDVFLDAEERGRKALQAERNYHREYRRKRRIQGTEAA